MQRRAAGPGGALPAEERIHGGHARLAEVDAHARLGVGRGRPDLLAELPQQLVRRVVGGHGDHAEHPLRGVVVGRQRGTPVRVEVAPLRVVVEALRRAVERVRVAEAAAADARAADHRHVLEDREAEDPAHPQPGREEVAAQVPRRARQLVVGEAAAALQHADAVALLGQPQRADAAAEAGPDDEPVEITLSDH
jgi:hypothetical protein